jgi:hypothetical protein
LEFEADFQRHELRRTKQTINNVKGINSQFLLPIDPIKIIVPILHVPMGLVDKVLEHHLHWLQLNVERLVGAEQMTRQRYRDSSAVLVISQRNLDDARALLTILNTPDRRIEVSEAQANKNSASSTNAKSKKAFEALTKNRNGRPESLKSRMEAIYRRWKISREHYHGGKFNGVNCIRIMEKSEEIFGEDGFTGVAMHVADTGPGAVETELSIREKSKNYQNLFGILDAIWANVRGVDAGLLATDEQLDFLERTVLKGKALWIGMGIGTLQPKWHLAFDGHLVHQAKKYRGLADKSEDPIEKGHQEGKEMNRRYGRIANFSKRHNCIRRALRRRRHHEIQFHIESFEMKKKQRTGGKRKTDAEEKQQVKRVAKKVKREGYAETAAAGGAN